MKTFLTEEDTKNRLITPALERSGWSKNLMMMEYNIRADRYQIVPDQNRTVQKNTRTRADYLLCHRVNMPIAVVEAKSTKLSAEEGLDQAIAYAKMLDLPFAYSSAGDKFIEFDLTTSARRELSMTQFPSPEDLWRRWCVARGAGGTAQEQIESALYHTTMDGKIPRYYQMVAINKAVNAVLADNRKRVLLVMATGTGKTYTAFQIVWRLRKAEAVRNVLYLADRNQLIDQTLVGDFTPFSQIQTKIRNGKIDKNYEIYFGLYQQLKGSEDEQGDAGYSVADRFKQVPKDYFDLIIVDECHRGSAREESSWREILTYFDSAIQIGLTATPNEKSGSDNAEYFGEPVYTYSLKQGIEDGFLAPFQVVSVHLDKDQEGWEPEEGECDDEGKPIPKRRYTLEDFGNTLELRQRTDTVARMVTDYLKHIGRMSKTIIFCTTQRHALAMRDAMRKWNPDMTREDPFYVVRMTGDDEEGRRLYEAFTSVKESIPVVVTTSKLLTTGADTKCVKLIVLDSNIRSMTEFKQIIGRGTRLRADAGKTFFTILDFRNACELFKDPNFNGNPDGASEWGEGDPVEEIKSKSADSGACTADNIQPEPPQPYVEAEVQGTPEHYVVGSVPVTVTGKVISYLDEDGNLKTDRFEDYTRRNILALYKSEADFLEVWNGPEEKKEILRKLAENGVIIEQLKKDVGNQDIDEFDLICSIAYGSTPMTRQLRASKARRSRLLEKYQGTCREVLERLIDIYAHNGVVNIDDSSVLKGESFKSLGGQMKIAKEFGGKTAYKEAVRELERSLYVPELSEAINKTYPQGAQLT